MDRYQFYKDQITHRKNRLIYIHKLTCNVHAETDSRIKANIYYGRILKLNIILNEYKIITGYGF